MALFYIALFGVLGVLSRFGLVLVASKVWPAQMPVATLLINVLGAFLIGVVYVAGIERSMISDELRLGITIGFLGGFTTFSAYCVEGFQLLTNSMYLWAAAYMILSPCFGLSATFAGVFLTRKIIGG